MTNDLNETTFSRLSAEDSARLRRKLVVTPTRTHRFLEYTLFTVVGALLLVGGLALYSTFAPQKAPNHMGEGIAADRVNLLIVGVAGDRKVGGGNDLADAIMLVSLKPSSHQVAIVSIPRDLWVRIGNYGTHRINRSNEIGQQSGYPGGGAALAMNTVGTVLQQPVHAFVRLDFSAFEKIIDDLGGIDIDVQRPFYDYLFHDSFPKGRQHMNGDRALRYARYRYIVGPEGDNFARELRQQQVINAVKQKLTERSPSDVLRLAASAATLSRYTDTNLSPTQMAWLYRNFHDIPSTRVRHVSLKPFVQIVNINSFAEAGEAVKPTGNDFTPIRSLVKNIFGDMRQVGTPDDIRLTDEIVTPHPATMNTAALR